MDKIGALDLAAKAARLAAEHIRAVPASSVLASAGGPGASHPAAALANECLPQLIDGLRRLERDVIIDMAALQHGVDAATLRLDVNMAAAWGDSVNFVATVQAAALALAQRLPSSQSYSGDSSWTPPPQLSRDGWRSDRDYERDGRFDDEHGRDAKRAKGNGKGKGKGKGKSGGDP